MIGRRAYRIGDKIMITIVNVLVGLGFAGTIIALASLIKITTKIIDDLMEDYEELQLDYNRLKEDREYWINMAVEMTDNYIDELGVLDDFVEPTEEEINNPFAVEHIDGYDVTEAKYVRDANGNWTVVDAHYEKN